jgi:hypothetical protein
MRELTHNELAFVSAGTFTCTVSVNIPNGVSVSCSGTPSDWRQVFGEAADAIGNFFDSLFG